ncbi:MAG: OmpA family protein [Burkholderiales bacterium]
MKSLHALNLISLAALACLASTPSLAQDSRYPYVGLSVGESRAKLDEQAIANSIIGPGVTTTSLSRDQNDTAYKLFGGYQFNRNIALEAGYFNLGRFGLGATTAPAGTLDGRIKMHGLNLDLVGTLPMTERWSALARVGAQYARTKDTFSGTGAVVVADPNPSKNKVNAKLGLGLQFALSPSVLLRGEAERYRINDAMGHNARVNVFSLGLVFPLGRTPAPVAQAYVAPAPAPEPAPVVQAPPPVVVAAAAAAAPVAPPPERQRVSFSAESLFTFNQSVVAPAGKTALDAFAKQVAGTRFDTINVEGHTDRIGSPAYNQALSLRRAEAVKAYLVTDGKFDPSKVVAVGKGESEPVTKPGDCKGKQASPKLIACLQPDRRVDIEVVGTR